MPKKNLTIPIYKAEREAGLAKAIQANASISYVTQLQDTKLSQEVVSEFLSSVAHETEDSQDQFDLFYLNTILVTVGWNKNDDVFPADETWAARYTPIHKQFNLEHDQSKIIGHMTTAKAVNEDFTLIDEDISVDELPTKFHIMTGAVIYKTLADEEAQANINKIIEEIEAGEWYVSMECLFRGFDYALTASTGEQRFLSRNDQTAFLTKHLRVYGGSGKYEDFTLGRALKNITFSGKGLVRKPANPESIILFNNGVKNFNASYASLGYITSSDNLIPTKGNDIMAENESTELTDKISALETEKTVSADKISKLEIEVNDLKAQNADLQTKLTEAEAQVAATKAEKLIRERTESLIKKSFAPEKAAELVKVFADKNDEEFTAIADLFAPVVVEKTETVPAVNKETVEEEVRAGVVVVETSTNDDIENTRMAMSSIFSDMMAKCK